MGPLNNPAGSQSYIARDCLNLHKNLLHVQITIKMIVCTTPSTLMMILTVSMERKATKEQPKRAPNLLLPSITTVEIVLMGPSNALIMWSHKLRLRYANAAFITPIIMSAFLTVLCKAPRRMKLTVLTKEEQHIEAGSGATLCTKYAPTFAASGPRPDIRVIFRYWLPKMALQLSRFEPCSAL